MLKSYNLKEQAQASGSTSLAKTPSGKCVRLVHINAEPHLQTQLHAMGLVPGAEIEVMRNTKYGPFLIAVKGVRLMLGHEIAQKIAVR